MTLTFRRSRALDVGSAGRNIARWFRELERAQRRLDATSEARRLLPAGSSRAKVTTANARYMSASEHVARCEKALRDLGVDVNAAIVAVYGSAGPVSGVALGGVA